MNDKIIGIIGGMGPEATANFYTKIIKNTKANKDQDHFRVIIDSNVKIPDRTEAILNGGENPLKAMIETAKNLESLGVELASIPCMTAHYFIDELQKNVSYQILNAFKELENYICEEYPNLTKIGVLATSGTISMGLFDKYLQKVEVLYPNKDTQTEKVMEAIYGNEGIKSGNVEGKPIQLLVEAGEELIYKGAEILVLGCTEIGLVIKPKHMSVPIVDPMDIVAKVMVK